MACSLLAGADGPARAGLTPEQRKLNEESFETVWRTVRDKHFDPKLGGLDWQAVHDELRPELDKAETMDQARAVLRKMLGRLKQSHFSIIASDVYDALDADKGDKAGKDKGGDGKPARSRSGQGVSGFDVRVVGDHVLVVKVDEGTPAAQLGVRPGWRVLKVDGEDLAPALLKVKEAFKDSPYYEVRAATAVTGRLRGGVGAKVPVVFLDGDDKEVALEVPLIKQPGQPAQFGNLPTFYVRFASHRRGDGVCYMSLNAFFDPERVMKGLEGTIQANRDAAGMVLDLRGNPGGIGFMAVGIGNWFVSKPDLKLGTLSTREASLHFVLNPRSEPYNGPLAVLVDGLSMSTSEILAGGLKDLGRAKIFGSRTPGAALPSQVMRLPNGDGFQYAFANYTSVGGQVLEGRGVTPDVEVRLDRRELLAGRDPVLEAAARWIKEQPRP
jgi:carboxyl-terminal processing protease